jgi:hypothetical protein
VKRPAFQVYPADWRKDSALQACSPIARGLWWELVCVMHECQPYGHLTINGKAASEAQGAALVHYPIGLYRKALAELEEAGVPSRTASGILFSRRMVRDERIRNSRAEGGKLGGNPALMPPEHVNGKDNLSANLTDNLSANLVPTPSSSSSSSSSPSTPTPKGTVSEKPLRLVQTSRATRLPTDWSLPDHLKQWAVDAHHLDPKRVVAISAAFRDFWIAKPGAGGCKLDWDATFRNWIRREMEKT